MKKLFITFSTVAVLICSSVSASQEFNTNSTHVEVTDNLSNYDENYGQFIEIKHLSEGSFTKSCLDKVVEVNNKLDQWEIGLDQWMKDHPHLINIAECAAIGACLCSVIANPIATFYMVAGSLILYEVIQLIAKKEDIIDYFVGKGYSEEEVTKYVCAVFELGEKFSNVIFLAFTPIRGDVTAARVNLAKFTKIGVKEAVSKMFPLFYMIKNQGKNFAKKFKYDWSGFGKFLSTPPLESVAVR